MVVIPAIYDSAFAFSEGVTPVKKNGKWFYIDTLGKPIHVREGGKTTYYKMARPYYFGMAVVRYIDNWSANTVTLIDKSGGGTFVDFSADEIGDMEKGYALIRNGNKYGIINICQDYLIPVDFDKIDSFSNGYVKVLHEGKWRILNPYGACIHNCIGYPQLPDQEREDDATVYFSNQGLKLSELSKGKLDKLAAIMIDNPAKRFVIEGNGNRSYAVQQNSWLCTNKVIMYLTDTKGIDRERFIFQYGLNGLYRSVHFREAAPGEEGPSHTPPPFPGYDCGENELLR